MRKLSGNKVVSSIVEHAQKSLFVFFIIVILFIIHLDAGDCPLGVNFSATQPKTGIYKRICRLFWVTTINDVCIQISVRKLSNLKMVTS